MKLIKKKLDNDKYKVSYLFNCIKFKLDIKARRAEYNLFGLKLVTAHFFCGIMIFHILGLFSIKTKCFTKKLLLNLLTRWLEQKHDIEGTDLIAFNCRSGETLLAAAHLHEYFEKNHIVSPLFISPFPHLGDIFNLFLPNVEFISIPYLFSVLHFCDIKTVTLSKCRYFEALNSDHFIHLEKRLQNGEDIDFYTALKVTMQVGEKEMLPLIYPEKIARYARKKMELLGLKEPFVYISPAAQSNGTLSKRFWENLFMELQILGYDVFFNENPATSSNSLYKTCFPSLGEARYIAEHAAAHIGIRSGLMDVIANDSSKIICLYKPFSARGKSLPPMDAKKVMTGFSLRHLPYTKKENVYEINCEEVDEEKLIEQIIKILN